MFSAGWHIAVLSVILISLSFDNAVLNASVLKIRGPGCQKLRLTLDILVGVFGMRLEFPLPIMLTTSDMSIVQAWHLALESPNEYSARLSAHHAEISAVSGDFLMLVVLTFLFDEEEDIHWLHWIESGLATQGKIKAVTVLVTLFSSFSLANMWCLSPLALSRRQRL